MNIVLPTLHVRRSAQAVPLAAACLAASLPQELRRDARLVDLFPEQSQQAMADAVLASAPDLVAFPTYVWNRDQVASLTRRLRQARPALFMVAGGPEATADPEGLLREGELDAVIRGEGEATFRELVRRLAEGGEPREVAGVTRRTAEGLVNEPDRSAVDELDALPSPWLSGVLTPEAGSGVLWETSRGCPFGCDFCFDARGSRGVRHLGEERLEAELALFVRAGVAQVWVLDSTFNFPPVRGKRLLRLIAERAPHIHFHFEAKADFLDRETARLLSRLSCSVQIGLQSARPEVLRNIHRTLDPAAFCSKVHLLSAEGVTFGLDVIYGLPGDDHQGFRQSLDTALAMAPNHLEMFPLAVLPGTPLHRQRQRFGLRAQDHPPYEIIESASYPAADLALSRRLAAAVDLFYNTGRAVGFFSALQKATGQSPVAFLEGFVEWALARPELEEKRFLNTEAWGPKEVLPLQEQYVTHLLRKQGREDLVACALDLMRYHYHHAEALLGPETLPAQPETLRNRDLWNIELKTSPSLQLVPFTYEILDLLEMGEVDLQQMASLFRPVGSVALFLRRGDQVYCESLEEGFLRLLNGCRKARTPKEIFGGSISAREGAEIVEFAVAEGFLVPVGR